MCENRQCGCLLSFIYLYFSYSFIIIDWFISTDLSISLIIIKVKCVFSKVLQFEGTKVQGLIKPCCSVLWNLNHGILITVHNVTILESLQATHRIWKDQHRNIGHFNRCSVMCLKSFQSQFLFRLIGFYFIYLFIYSWPILFLVLQLKDLSANHISYLFILILYDYAKQVVQWLLHSQLFVKCFGSEWRPS